MTKVEFAEVIAYLELMTGKPIHDEPHRALERTRGYYQALGDLPLDVLRIAAEKVVIERKWPTFPQVAELREVAVAIVQQRNALPDVGEAWETARQVVRTMRDETTQAYVVCRGGVMVPTKEWNRLTLAALPPVLTETIRQFGWQRICDTSPDQLGVAFAQFRGIYEACAGRVKSERLLPAATKQRMQAIAGTVGQIGVMP